MKTKKNEIKIGKFKNWVAYPPKSHPRRQDAHWCIGQLDNKVQAQPTRTRMTHRVFGYESKVFGVLITRSGVITTRRVNGLLSSVKARDVKAHKDLWTHPIKDGGFLSLSVVSRPSAICGWQHRPRFGLGTFRGGRSSSSKLVGSRSPSKVVEMPEKKPKQVAIIGSGNWYVSYFASF